MKNLAFIGLLASAFTLASCGGGTTIPSNLVLPGSPQSYLSPPTYVQGTDEYNAFYAINTFRFNLGLGYWQQNVLLDQAAQNHMAYSTANDSSFEQDLETEATPALTGFTGTTPSLRAIYSNYYVFTNTITQTNIKAASVGELYSVGTGANVLQTMANTVYHRSGLMTQSTRSVGLARDTSGTASANTHWWISHGKLDSGQSVPSSYFSVYPLNQMSNVPLSMTMESPSVFPAYTTAAQFAANTSSPISIHTAAINKLNVTNITVTMQGSGTPLPGKVFTMSNDPNLNTASYSAAALNLTSPPPPAPTIPGYEAYWIGTAPFLPNTTYTVNFTGSTYLTVYGLSNNVAQTWTFTTASQ